MSKYIHDKKAIVELATSGCERHSINSFENNRKKAMSEEVKRTNREFDKKEYLEGGPLQEKFGKMPIVDPPPLTFVKTQGEKAEFAVIVNIASGANIFTAVDLGHEASLEKNETVEDYKTFLLGESINKARAILFTPGKVKDLQKVVDNTGSESAKFKVDFTSGKIVENFLKVFDESKSHRFVFQSEFPETTMLYEDICDLYGIDKVSPEIIKEFKKFRPDLIEILPQSTEVSVLNNEYKVVRSHPNKTKLKVYDIKMSQYSSRFPIELAYYMIRLQHFLKMTGLDAYYEVCSDGAILPYDSRKLFAIMTRFEEMQKWEVLFETEGSKILNVFKTNLQRIYATIQIKDSDEENEKDKNIYNTFIDTPRCKTCEFYGEQRSEIVVSRVKDRAGENMCSNEDFTSFYEEYGYCRARSVKNDDINTLRNLSSGLKALLKQNEIFTVDDLFDQIHKHSIFKENKNLAVLVSDFEQLMEIRKGV